MSFQAACPLPPFPATNPATVETHVVDTPTSNALTLLSTGAFPSWYSIIHFIACLCLSAFHLNPMHAFRDPCSLLSFRQRGYNIGTAGTTEDGQADNYYLQPGHALSPESTTGGTFHVSPPPELSICIFLFNYLSLNLFIYSTLDLPSFIHLLKISKIRSISVAYNFLSCIPVECCSESRFR